MPRKPRPPAPTPEHPCPHCGCDLDRFTPGDERFDHLLSCARQHDDPEREQRRQGALLEMLLMLPFGAEGLRRYEFGPPPQREAPRPATTKPTKTYYRR